ESTAYRWLPSSSRSIATWRLSASTSSSRRRTDSFSAASSAGETKLSAAGCGAAAVAVDGAPESRCAHRFSRAPGWRGSSATSALSVSGYVSGTVRCFSTSTPSTRVSSSDNAGSLGTIAAVRSRTALLPPIRRREARLVQLVRVEHESDHGSARIFVGVDLVHLERIDGEDVAMRLVTLRRTRAAVAGLAEIVLGLHRPLRCLAARRIADAGGQRRHIGRNVEHDPMPPPAAGWRIGVVHGHREALGSCRRILPDERRRDVAAVAAEALVQLRRRDRRAGLDFGAFEAKGTGRERG